MKKFALYLDHTAKFNSMDRIEEIEAEDIVAAMEKCNPIITTEIESLGEHSLWAGYLYEKKGKEFNRKMGSRNPNSWFVAQSSIKLLKNKFGFEFSGC